ncbi:MAG TPA: hypothetical protein VFG58_03685 [Solirubrobacterales bacterium]|nr:hypothetical protein [Solirubrobacterales bacterium]
MSENRGQVLRRSIGIVFDDGALLALSGERPRGAGEHGDERLATVLREPDGSLNEVSETLLSTEYGPDGVQRRATLELWTDREGGQALRGGGTLIGASEARGPGTVSEVAFFRWALEGREGLGHYELVREDD